jgi:hypothetical protein
MAQTVLLSLTIPDDMVLTDASLTDIAEATRTSLALSVPDLVVTPISDRQRHYLRKSVAQFIAEDPGWEEDENGEDIPTVLWEMLAPTELP